MSNDELQIALREVNAANLRLERQLKAMTEERDCWIANAHNLQVGYNKLDAELRKLREVAAQV